MVQVHQGVLGKAFRTNELRRAFLRAPPCVKSWGYLSGVSARTARNRPRGYLGLPPSHEKPRSTTEAAGRGRMSPQTLLAAPPWPPPTPVRHALGNQGRRRARLAASSNRIAYSSVSLSVHAENTRRRRSAYCHHLLLRAVSQYTSGEISCNRSRSRRIVFCETPNSRTAARRVTASKRRKCLGLLRGYLSKRVARLSRNRRI